MTAKEFLISKCAGSNKINIDSIISIMEKYAKFREQSLVDKILDNIELTLISSHFVEPKTYKVETNYKDYVIVDFNNRVEINKKSITKCLTNY